MDPESDEFLCALDRLWEKMLSERVAEIVGLRREQTWSADEPGWEGNSSLDYYPRRDVWRTTVHTGRTAGGEEVYLQAERFPLVSQGVISPGATLVQQLGDVIRYHCLTQDPGELPDEGDAA